MTESPVRLPGLPELPWRCGRNIILPSEASTLSSSPIWRRLTSVAGKPQETYLNFRNNLLLLHKNLPLRRGRKVLLLRRLADTLAFLMFLAKLDVPNARAVIRAHGDFRKMSGVIPTKDPSFS